MSVVNEVIWVLLGFLYGCLFEYLFHRYIFHGLGKKKSSFFAFHLREHHLNARRDGFRDERFSSNELFGIPILIVTHIPMYFISPALYFTVCTHSLVFVFVHNISHRYPELSKKWLWWHWNHHMKNQNKSWGVVCPLVDILTGTLEEKEKN